MTPEIITRDAQLTEISALDEALINCAGYLQQLNEVTKRKDELRDLLAEAHQTIARQAYELAALKAKNEQMDKALAIIADLSEVDADNPMFLARRIARTARKPAPTPKPTDASQTEGDR